MELSRAAACILGIGAILFADHSVNAHQYGAGALAALVAWISLMGYIKDLPGLNWPLMSRARHDAEAELWGRISSEKDESIKKLEAERRLLWDKICLLGIGAP